MHLEALRSKYSYYEYHSLVANERDLSRVNINSMS